MKTSTKFDGEKALGLLLYRNAMLIRGANLKALKESGHEITPEQWLVLFELDQNKNISQKELGNLVYKDKTNITRLIDQLEKLDYVKRVDDPKDRRRFKLKITSTGKKIKDKVISVSKEVAKKNYQIFSDKEKEECIKLLNKLYHHLNTNN